MANLPATPGPLSNAGPRSIQLDASTVCQLRCPCCSTAQGNTARVLGAGHLALSAFRHLLDCNPGITDVELSNYGEIFLNPHLLDLLRCAHERNVVLHADNGVNLNHATDEVLEGLIKYRVQSITCSIDGADNDTYRRYRIGGDFERVIRNIRTINEHKIAYRSGFPILTWQFVVFGHNEHQITEARALASTLNMDFRTKISWDNTFSPIKNEELVRINSGQPATRQEYSRTNGVNYMRKICSQLWRRPTINWDGMLLGCCINHWGDFGPNVFEEGLFQSLHSEKMNYARAMLMGAAESRVDIPCTTCNLYKEMKSTSNWLNCSEVADLEQTVTLSVVLPRVGEARRVRLYVLPGKIRSLSNSLITTERGVDFIRGEHTSVITTLSSTGEHTVCVAPVVNDRPTLECHKTYYIQIPDRPTCQEVFVPL